MRLRKAFQSVTRQLLLLALTATIGFSLVGCATLGRQVTLHPIEKSDIFSVEKDVDCGGVKTEKSGWFLSDYYVEEVMKAKVG